MQFPYSEVQLLRATKTGIPGREKTTYEILGTITGSLSAMSLADYTKQYVSPAYVDNGAYAFETQENLKTSDVVAFESRKFKVIGVKNGRMRNHVHLMVMANE